MWVFVVTSFTRYSKIGREAFKVFERKLKTDGFYRLHQNLFLRYCSTGANAVVHKKRVKNMIPDVPCDISIILVSDNQEQNIYHFLSRRHSKHIAYSKPENVEFF